MGYSPKGHSELDVTEQKQDKEKELIRSSANKQSYKNTSWILETLVLPNLLQEQEKKEKKEQNGKEKGKRVKNKQRRFENTVFIDSSTDSLVLLGKIRGILLNQGSTVAAHLEATLNCLRGTR